VSSLRLRLMAGFALVAVVPLVIAIVLLSRRIEATVRAEAALRLDAAVGGLSADLNARRKETEAKLAIVSRDPTLRRLYLVRGSSPRELRDHLAERQFLLGLDFLEILDPSGAVAAGDSDSAWSSRARLELSSDAPILYDAQTVGILRGGVLLDDEFLARLKSRTGLELVLTDAEGNIVATTLERSGARRIPVHSSVRRIEVAGRSYLGRSYALDLGSSSSATISGLVPTTESDHIIAALRSTAALLGLFGLLVAILLGTAWSSQISRPVEQLADYSRRLARGEWDQPLDLRSVRELATLVQALDRMRRDLIVYRERLVTSERQAAWSHMARKVAHEVKNPLTPIAVSVASLKRSYEQGRPDFPEILDQAVRTVQHEVDSLKRLLQEFSDFARFPAPQLAPTGVRDLLADLEALYSREIEEGTIAIFQPPCDWTIQADRSQIRQALVNLVKNGLEALDGDGRVSLLAEASETQLVLQIADTGPGLTDEQRRNLFLPGFTTKAHGSGLGLTIVQRIVSDHGGTIAAESRPGGGTSFRLTLPLEGTKPCPPF
jgi:two-component system, NtrC family, nitrogen regulation sensor histidine kinase NtrY